jgi:hypothetical protein
MFAHGGDGGMNQGENTVADCRLLKAIIFIVLEVDSRALSLFNPSAISSIVPGGTGAFTSKEAIAIKCDIRKRRYIPLSDVNSERYFYLLIPA